MLWRFTVWSGKMRKLLAWGQGWWKVLWGIPSLGRNPTVYFWAANQFRLCCLFYPVCATIFQSLIRMLENMASLWPTQVSLCSVDTQNCIILPSKRLYSKEWFERTVVTPEVQRWAGYGATRCLFHCILTSRAMFAVNGTAHIAWLSCILFLFKILKRPIQRVLQKASIFR